MIKYSSFWVAPFLSLLMLGCAVPSLTQDAPETPAQWANAGHGTQSDLHEWWTQFHDDDLNWLVTQTITESPDIRLYAARIAEARGFEKSSFANLFPSVSATADIAQSRSALFTPMTGRNYDAAFDASYELDLFGKNREAHKAADLGTLAATKDYDWVKQSLIAEVVRTYIEMRAAQQQTILAQKNQGTEKETASLVTRQFKAGNASDADVQRVRLQVNQSTARIADYTRQQQVFLQALTTLSGMTADSIAAHIAPTRDIPHADLQPVADAPAVVLARRPDIAAASARLAQATSLKTVQADAVFPTINLSGLFGLTKSILVDTTTVWSIGANAAVNVLDFGRIQGQIDAASARETQAYEAWRKAVLTGMQDVETSLINVTHIQEQQHALVLAKDNAARASAAMRTRYREGDRSLLDVLDTQRQVIETDSALIDADKAYMISIVALYKALGPTE